jgi:preprotein translocase subunit SecG
MSLIIGFLTIVLVLTSFFLILLILAQLPKKEAGAGLAFGAGAAEAVFGAGAGTPLSKITKIFATLFLGLAVLLGVMNSYESKRSSRLIDEAAANQAATTTPNAGETVTDPSVDPVTPAAIPATDSEEGSEEVATIEKVPAEADTPTLEPSSPGIENTEPLTLEPEVPVTQPNPDN